MPNNFMNNLDQEYGLNQYNDFVLYDKMMFK
jgi:hypothetical protein